MSDLIQTLASLDQEARTNLLLNTLDEHYPAEKLHTLLWRETTDSGGHLRNAWYVAWQRFGAQDREAFDRLDRPEGPLARFFATVERASAHTRASALAAVDDEEAAPASALLCRYTLMASSVGSLSNELPLPLLAALAEYEIWTPFQALAYLRRIPADAQRAAALVRLIPLLAARTQTLDVLDSLADLDLRTTTLARVAGKLSRTVHERALKSANAPPGFAGNHAARAALLAALAPALRDEGVAKLLEAIEDLTEPDALAQVLIAVAPLITPEHLPAFSQRAERCRGHGLARFPGLVAALACAYARCEQPQVARDLLHEIPRAERRLAALAQLIPVLGQPWQDAALGALRALATLAQPLLDASPELLVELLPYLAADRFHEAVYRLLAMWEPSEGAWLFGRLPASLSEARRTTILGAALELLHSERRGGFGNLARREHALTALIPHLPAGLLPRALEVEQALLVARMRDRAEVKAELLSPNQDLDARLALRDKQFSQRDAIEAQVTMLDSSYIADHLVPLVDIVSRDPQQLGDRLAPIIDAVPSETGQLHLLAGLADHLPEPLVRKGVALALRMAVQPPPSPVAPDQKPLAARAFARLAGRLPEAAMAQTYQHAVRCAQNKLLATLSPRLPEHLRRQALQELQSQMCSLPNEPLEVIAAVAPLLPLPASLRLALARSALRVQSAWQELKGDALFEMLRKEYGALHPWRVARQVIEEQQDVLLDPSIEMAIEITTRMLRDDAEAEHLFAMLRQLLRQCRYDGIEAAFADLPADEPKPRLSAEQFKGLDWRRALAGFGIKLPAALLNVIPTLFEKYIQSNEKRQEQLSQLFFRVGRQGRVQPAEMREAAERALDEQPELRESLVHLLSDLAASNPQVTSALQRLFRRSLGPTLLDYLKAPGWREALAYLREHPELLRDKALGDLDALIRHLQQQSANPDLAAHLARRRALLVRAIHAGIDHVSTELAIGGLLEQGSWQKQRVYLQAHPDLLDDGADRSLLQMATQARQQGRQAAAQGFDQYRALFARCHEVGIEQAFAELEERLILRGLTELHEATTWTACQQCLAAHTLLWAEEGVARLALIREANQRAGNVAVVHLIDEHQTLLARCREVGVAQAIGERVAFPAEVPPPFATHILTIRDAERRYALSLERADSEALLAAWTALIDSPGFALAPVPFRHAVLDCAAGAYLHNYGVFGGDLDRLDTALDYWRRLVDELPPSDARRAALVQMGASFYKRSSHTADIDDIDASIACFRQALSAGPEDATMEELLGLALSLYERHHAYHPHIADLDEAIRLYRDVLTRQDLAAPVQRELRTRLSVALGDRYAAIGELRDLEEALRYQEL